MQSLTATIGRRLLQSREFPSLTGLRPSRISHVSTTVMSEQPRLFRLTKRINKLTISQSGFPTLLSVPMSRPASAASPHRFLHYATTSSATTKAAPARTVNVTHQEVQSSSQSAVVLADPESAIAFATPQTLDLACRLCTTVAQKTHGSACRMAGQTRATHR
jgi:hypothetical protein